MIDVDAKPLLVHDLILETAIRTPDAPALVDGKRCLGYHELASQLRGFAGQLAALGLPPGSRIAVYLPKSVANVVALYGAMAAGHVAVPINPGLKSAQVDHILADSGAALLVTSKARAEALAGSHDIPHIHDDDWGSGFAQAALPDIAPDHLAMLLYTSGSTGRAKGVMLSHANLVLGAKSVTEYLGITAAERILALLPLSFDYGLNQLNAGFLAGACVVLHSYLLARDVVRIVARERITGLAAVPPLWHQLAAVDWDDAGHGLRYFTNSGGHMPRGLLAKLRAIFPRARVHLMYGLTEAFRSTSLDPELVDRYPDSIGRAIPLAKISVRRADGGLCAPGEIGELVHGGPLVAQGYWQDPARSAERFRGDGEGRCVWSGDKVRMDADGLLYFVGRDDAMIKSLGHRISPTEIEEALLGSGLVSEAAAVGIADAEMGQKIACMVTPVEAADSGALLDYCRRVLPGHMLPGVVIWRDHLPRNANGKLDRVAIAREMGGS